VYYQSHKRCALSQKWQVMTKEELWIERLTITTLGRSKCKVKLWFGLLSCDSCRCLYTKVLKMYSSFLKLTGRTWELPEASTSFYLVCACARMRAYIIAHLQSTLVACGVAGAAQAAAM
jgi:hypothetical protein